MEPENPEFIQPKTTAELLSAARREFINSKRYDGPTIIALASLFDCIAKEVHGYQCQLLPNLLRAAFAFAPVETTHSIEP